MSKPVGTELKRKYLNVAVVRSLLFHFLRLLRVRAEPLIGGNASVNGRV
jgi:hypothetical protein